MPDSEILCACGCGQPVPKRKYPSQGQQKFINLHQHRGIHNGNYKGGDLPKCCPICNKTFYVRMSIVDVRVTCGADSCYREWQRLITTARGKNKVTLICPQCGKRFCRWPAQIKDRDQVFCGRKCLGIWHSANAHANLLGNWKGGKWGVHKRAALERDNNRCVICGFDLIVDVHHITPKANEGADHYTNLITLCPNHHKLADMQIINVEHLRRTEELSI